MGLTMCCSDMHTIDETGNRSADTAHACDVATVWGATAGHICVTVQQLSNGREKKDKALPWGSHNGSCMYLVAAWGYNH